MMVKNRSRGVSPNSFIFCGVMMACTAPNRISMMRFAGMSLRISPAFRPSSRTFPKYRWIISRRLVCDEHEHVGLFPLDVPEKGGLNFFHVPLKT